MKENVCERWEGKRSVLRKKEPEAKSLKGQMMPEASLQSGEGDSEASCHCRERGHESLGVGVGEGSVEGVCDKMCILRH